MLGLFENNFVSSTTTFTSVLSSGSSFLEGYSIFSWGVRGSSLFLSCFPADAAKNWVEKELLPVTIEAVVWWATIRHSWKNYNEVNKSLYFKRHIIFIAQTSETKNKNR